MHQIFGNNIKNSTASGQIPTEARGRRNATGYAGSRLNNFSHCDSALPFFPKPFDGVLGHNNAHRQRPPMPSPNPLTLALFASISFNKANRASWNAWASASGTPERENCRHSSAWSLLNSSLIQMSVIRFTTLDRSASVVREELASFRTPLSILTP